MTSEKPKENEPIKPLALVNTIVKPTLNLTTGEYEGKLLRNGHLNYNCTEGVDAVADEESESADALTARFGTICIRGLALDGALELEEVKACIYRKNEVPNPLPSNPDLLTPAQSVYLREGLIGSWTLPGGVETNYRFLRHDPPCRHDVGLGKQHGSNKNDNRLCMWFKFAGAWSKDGPHTLSLTLSDTNDCGEALEADVT
ncbi:hypothetical protein [Lignipirellula cremea]|uniref:Uncharacterized protein n=1 Tax=Lignipirellula cremea TaxID=2528010 RepID=A0A518E3L4_9BACT|nr:hypothetical protein [Lignipirellula cremea]QDU98677.1 hypothetical protein Pla8534_65500 [Lignipirellula cremea]